MTCHKDATCLELCGRVRCARLDLVRFVLAGIGTVSVWPVPWLLFLQMRNLRGKEFTQRAPSRQVTRCDHYSLGNPFLLKQKH
jgi:hypothetical protein